MTLSQANAIINRYFDIANPSAEDRSDFAEAMCFLYNETGDTSFLVSLASVYFGEKMYDFAIKYFELAAGKGDAEALTNLGYIWYYGQTGEIDYAKAFSCFDKAWEWGDLSCGLKIAEMYRKGQYVEASEEKYIDVIEYLAKQVEERDESGSPLPEIYSRLAGIRAGQGRRDEALLLFDRAKGVLARRLVENPYSADFLAMKGLIRDIYTLRVFNPEETDFYDLYFLLNRPGEISFRYNGKEYCVEALPSAKGCSVRFGDERYASVDDFFELAAIDGLQLSRISDQLTDFKIN